MSLIAVLGHICWKDRLAVLHVPGVLRHQMAGTALRSGCIGYTIIEGAYARKVRTRVQSTMNMTALTIPHNNKVIFVRRQLASESLLERIRSAGSKT
jgi:hypothetical protein